MKNNNKFRLDVWGAITLGTIALYALFLLYPMAYLIRQSVLDPDTGGFTLAYFTKFFSKSYYFDTLINSFKVSITATVLSIAIGTPLAYLFTIFKIKGKPVLNILIVVASMSAPFIGAYSWILLLGRSGIITAFFKNLGIAIPDKDVTIEYYSEATEVTAQMANTEDAIAVLPQPYVTAAGLQDDTLRVALDLTEEWNKVADTQLITGVTVVRKEYAEEHPDVVAAFLTDYAKSVEAANADLDGTAALCEEQGVVAKAAIAKKALPNCNIVCLTGEDRKSTRLNSSHRSLSRMPSSA